MNSSPLSVLGLSADQVWNFENGFHWFSDPCRINKLLAHYELYRMITGLPGHVMELGVYKGCSLIRFATFRDALEAVRSRKIIGFDAFGAFPTDGLATATDLAFIERFEQAGGRGLQLEEMQAILQHKGISHVELVAGNVFSTLPAYLEKHPETKLALLHLDMDVKEPTAFALELLYDRIVPGGLLVFDDYNAVAGETQAVDEFVAQRGLRLEKLPHYYVPAFVRKP